MASAAASGGTVGWVSSPKMRSALVASCVSSQSSAWPLVPFSSAADAAPVRNADRAECRRLGAGVSLAHVGAQNAAGVLRRAGEHHAEPVDDAALPDGNRFGGKILRMLPSR